MSFTCTNYCNSPTTGKCTIDGIINGTDITNTFNCNMNSSYTYKNNDSEFIIKCPGSYIVGTDKTKGHIDIGCYYEKNEEKPSGLNPIIAIIIIIVVIFLILLFIYFYKKRNR